MKLLIFYHIIPEDVYQFVIDPTPPQYGLWEQAHGCLLNTGYEDSYSQDVKKMLTEFDAKKLSAEQFLPDSDISDIKTMIMIWKNQYFG